MLAGFGLLLLWPLFSALIPEIHLPLWAHWRMHDSVTIQTTFLPGTNVPVRHTFNGPALIWLIGM